ncbi:nucleotide exchange factor GrpE [Acholeplasma vituli]|uniref:Protein GrpE n=1 Tax=Paracholeplasma vituli TaxID=69473 RepID=A0ABT2PUP4_9MOLU|nr:nucleotide exchange factor GrpE [Paracholeplasma vituli]MCU0104652.1 nucleotide exchange factor GrpE [Paracholeplasma vituli]
MDEQKKDTVNKEQVEHEKPEKEKKKSEKDKLKDEIESLKGEIASLKDQYLRERAELENYKKRIQQERIVERKYASQNVVEALLGPLDQLKIVTNMTVDNDLLKNYLIGFKMINDQIFNILEQEGLKEIKAMNEMFDPNIHHAIDIVKDEEKPKGMILGVQQTGYLFKERVVRPAMVKVNEWSDENGNN